MKDQYVADIGDYGKYSLLKAFADEGVRLGINWYYTEGDGGPDGKFTRYLQDEKKMRSYDPEVFDVLKKVYAKERSIGAFEQTGILKNTMYYRKKMVFVGTKEERKAQRLTWFNDSLDQLSGSELVFLDPDNGLLVRKDQYFKGAEKYVLQSEIERLYENHSVVYYCHKGRRANDAWEKYKAAMLYRLPCAQSFVLTYHKGTQRSFIFLIHPSYVTQYREIIDRICSRWDGVFTKETAIIQPYQ